MSDTLDARVSALEYATTNLNSSHSTSHVSQVSATISPQQPVMGFQFQTLEQIQHLGNLARNIADRVVGEEPESPAGNSPKESGATSIFEINRRLEQAVAFLDYQLRRLNDAI